MEQQTWRESLREWLYGEGLFITVHLPVEELGQYIHDNPQIESFVRSYLAGKFIRLSATKIHNQGVFVTMVFEDKINSSGMSFEAFEERFCSP